MTAFWRTNTQPRLRASLTHALDQLGVIEVSDETREVLERFAEQTGEERTRDKVANILRLTTATQEFQRN